MKAKIKGTNTIVKCRGIGTLINENTGIECQHIDGSIEVIPADCLIELSESFDIKEPFNWQSFRNQAAKDILCAMLTDQRISETTPYKDLVKRSLECTNELIKKLKEKEEK